VQPVLVNDHDFRSDAIGIAVPYGIYDLNANQGTVFVGTSSDTPGFAVDCAEHWWRTEGRQRYPDDTHLGILADGGGSNSATSRAWKYGLQTKLCNRHGLTVTVAHYPPGASKWNPIEHRLFSEISKNWAGRPLDSYETILNYLRTTATSTGLRVQAHLVAQSYQKGVKITDAQMRELAIAKHEDLPKWNYTLSPA
ncbi:MAG: ISAzo13 family transposase, partial [Gammaproteobacteria bacterium]